METTILIILASLLVGRLFSESLAILPRFADLLDLVFVPVLVIAMLPIALLKEKTMKLEYEQTIATVTNLCLGFLGVSILSAILNYQRVHFMAVSLYVFGMLEGPVLFLAIEYLMRKKSYAFIKDLKRFGALLFFAQIAAVIFVNFPQFVADDYNPDKISGTFGLNGYQFSVMLIIFAGFFLGKQMVSKLGKYYGIAIQLFIIGIFLLMQYRMGTPFFLLSYMILLGVLYGNKIKRFLALMVVIAAIAYVGFSQIEKAGLKFRYEDLVSMSGNMEEVAGFGKALAYARTVDMFFDMPHTILVGCGPGTMISKASVTFITDTRMYGTAKSSQKAAKGVGQVMEMLFGDLKYTTDVYEKYIYQLQKMDALYGSAQFNNTASSLLAPLAETGVVGCILMFWLYIIVIKRSLRYLRFAVQTRDPELLPWAAALFCGVVYLICLTPLDNYFESSRVTLPIWTMFWMVGRMYEDRWRTRLEKVQRLQELKEAHTEELRRKTKIFWAK